MESKLIGRREALQCLAYGGAGTLYVLAGGILTPVDVARGSPAAGVPLFVQISDTHIGFNKEANPDVGGTLKVAIERINALKDQPAFILHTGDITHLSRAAEFDAAAELLKGLRASELHTVPGEHDVADATVSEYFARFGQASANRGYYSFDHHGVHLVGLINVLNFKPNGLGALGPEQMAWLEADLKARSSSTPVVVFAHMPLWNLYEPWGWGTAEAPEVLALLKRFGSVTVLNGHIHQIVQKVEGHVTFHTARSTAFPQPPAGQGAGPGPMKVPAAELPAALGISTINVTRHPATLSLADATLA